MVLSAIEEAPRTDGQINRQTEWQMDSHLTTEWEEGSPLCVYFAPWPLTVVWLVCLCMCVRGGGECVCGWVSECVCICVCVWVCVCTRARFKPLCVHDVDMLKYLCVHLPRVCLCAETYSDPFILHDSVIFQRVTPRTSHTLPDSLDTLRCERSFSASHVQVGISVRRLGKVKSGRWPHQRPMYHNVELKDNTSGSLTWTSWIAMPTSAKKNSNSSQAIKAAEIQCWNVEFLGQRTVQSAWW